MSNSSTTKNEMQYGILNNINEIGHAKNDLNDVMTKQMIINQAIIDSKKPSFIPLVENVESSTTYPHQNHVQNPESTPLGGTFHSHRIEKYNAQNMSADIIFEYTGALFGIEKENTLDRLNFHKTIKCLRVPIGQVSVNKSIKYKKSFYNGTVVCGNAWTCPVCAEKIQSRRAIEIQKFFQWAYKDEQHQVMMITFTYPHSIGDVLADTLSKHTEAMRLFRQGNSYTLFKNRIGYEGLIRALEVTYGTSGWHPHTHELFAVKFNISKAEQKEIYEFILNRWQNCCIKAGLLDINNAKKVKDFRKHAVDIKFKANDSDYLAKQGKIEWGADKEMAHISTKKGKKSGLAPFQLLQMLDNDKKNPALPVKQIHEYRRLYLEYVLAMKGKAQLFWSAGLKDKVGIADKTDEQLAKEQEDKADLVALLSKLQWKIVVKNNARAEILNIADLHGIDGLINWFLDYGLTLDKPYPYD